MTILQLLLKILPAAQELVDFLNLVKQRLPDLAPKIDYFLAALNASIDASWLANLAAKIIDELKDIAQGKIRPGSSPSNLI